MNLISRKKKEILFENSTDQKFDDILYDIEANFILEIFKGLF